MNPCATVQKYLSSYLDQSLDPQLRQEIDSHIQECPECAKILQDLKFLTSRLKNVQTLQASDSFEKNLRQRIIDNTATKEENNPLKTFSYGLSAAAILVAVYFFINTNPTTPSDNIISPAPSKSSIMDARMSEEITTNPDLDKETNTQMAVDDSIESKRLTDEEQREINLVDQ
ncbi:MAG: zf-HC2 domain-containing protein [Calditrichaceae bacterium]|nr:zf-HC2 domain-containing protein [Calditrichaceae bacterium]MBN2708310.1 zf-HC2 domain-containing protein [Calditrichaceae bacterium]